MSLPTDFLDKYGPWAVVTGASSGIGAEFARQLAGAGLSVVLVARRQDRIEALAKTLSESYPIQTMAIPADLSTESGRAAVGSGTTNVDVGLLVNNAGVELHGSFFRDPADKHLQLIDVNVSAVTYLAHAFGRRLADRGRGGIIFVSSVAARMFPWLATYSASKSFVTSLAVVLREELGQKGVDVLALEPGLVISEMSEVIAEEIDFAKIGFSTQTAGECVEEALRSLHAKNARVTPGLMNKVSLFVLGLIPGPILMKILGVAMAQAVSPKALGYK